MLETALKGVEKRKRKKFWTHFCTLAYKDNQVAIALARKLVGDKKQIEAKVDLGPPEITITVKKTYAEEPKVD
jgi:hypothetical protein